LWADPEDGRLMVVLDRTSSAKIAAFLASAAWALAHL
jgi:hypothetical protein